MPVATTIEAIAAAAMVLGVVYSSGRLSARVDENTRATEKLTAAYTTHSEKTDMRLADHEVRIALLEKK